VAHLKGERPMPRVATKETSFMKLRITSLTLLSGLVLMAAVASSLAAAQGTPAQQQACTGDAMRLCSAFIPDVGRVTSCMARHRGSLSAACRAAMGGGKRPHHRRSHG
jgi:hypothetical protein